MNNNFYFIALLVGQGALLSRNMSFGYPCFFSIHSPLKKKIVSLFLAALVFVAVLRFSPVVMSAGLLSRCGARPSHCSGFSCCWAHALGQGSVTRWQVWSSQTREPTHVPWIGRQTLNHWTPGAVLHSILLAVFRPVESRPGPKVCR